MKTLGKKAAGTRWARMQASPAFKDGSFHNILPTEISRRDPAMFRAALKFFTASVRTKPPKPIPHEKTDLHSLPDHVPHLVWFGHSSYLLKYRGFKILVDPVFSGHASPFSWMVRAYPGSDVYSAKDMPEIDLLVITHDHYDHLDYATMLELKPKIKKICTTLGVGAHLEYWGFDPALISELDWWESLNFAPGVTLTAAPTRHFSGRSFTPSPTLWAAFSLQWGDYKFFLGGDSGFDSQFKVIGEKLGPFDWAFLECGQYNEAWPLIHMFPERTAQAAKDLRAKVCMPVHWAKFSLSLHSWNEPIHRVIKAAEELQQSLAIPKIGQSIALGDSLPTSPWWDE